MNELLASHVPAASRPSAAPAPAPGGAAPAPGAGAPAPGGIAPSPDSATPAPDSAAPAPGGAAPAPGAAAPVVLPGSSGSNQDKLKVIQWWLDTDATGGLAVKQGFERLREQGFGIPDLGNFDAAFNWKEFITVLYALVHPLVEAAAAPAAGSSGAAGSSDDAGVDGSSGVAASSSAPAPRRRPAVGLQPQPSGHHPPIQPPQLAPPPPLPTTNPVVVGGMVMGISSAPAIVKRGRGGREKGQGDAKKRRSRRCLKCLEGGREEEQAQTCPGRAPGGVCKFFSDEGAALAAAPAAAGRSTATRAAAVDRAAAGAHAPARRLARRAAAGNGATATFARPAAVAFAAI